MKVLFVSSGSRSGLSPIIKNQGESLINTGVELDYFLLKEGGIRGYLKAIFELKKYLKNHKIDIIHAHYGYCGIVSHFARTSERLVVSFMGSELLGQKVSGKNISGILFRNLNNLLCRYYDHVIVKSAEMLKYLDKENNNYSVIPNGVSFDKFYPMDQSVAREHLGYELDEIIIIFPANPIRAEKNYSLAEEAINLLKREVRLVTFVNIPNQDLVYYYNACDLVLFTSIYEGSPNVIKEALACNCRILSTPCGDVPEVIADSVGADLISYKHKEVAEALIRALSSDDIPNGRETISHLRDDVIAEKIIKIYNTIRGF